MILNFTEDSSVSLGQAARDGQFWLFNAAAPLWSRTGRTTSGLFSERMTLSGEPDSSYFRTFVQARHIFSFATLGKMSWHGPWRELVGETMEVVVRKAKRPDGFFCHRLGSDATSLDSRADLYDQAFVLLALAAAGNALGRSEWFDEAEALCDVLVAKWRHPLGGFQEGEVVDPRIRRQNPHMHLLEALLGLHDASGRVRFKDEAEAIARLARDKFIEPKSGALLEYFTDELLPAAGIEGRIAEPGHCFEWAWLFERFARSGWGEGILLSDRLVGFARSCGLDSSRSVAINEVLTDGKSRDMDARLWPQTERLKAAVVRLCRLQTEAELQESLAACRGLSQYLDVPTPGLWRDKLKGDGSWVDELVPGSSFYHITCAYAELYQAQH